MALGNFVSEFLKAKWRERLRSRSAIERRANRRLEHILHHARTQVPFFQDRIGTDLDLQCIPPVTKGEMMSRFEDTLARGTITVEEIDVLVEDTSDGPKWIRDEYLISKTSGTTGERAVFITNRAAWDEQRAAVFARCCRGFNPLKRVIGRLCGEKLRMANVIADCPFCVTRQSALDSKKNARFMSDVLVLSIQLPEDEVITQLDQFQPHLLLLYPSAIASIARKKLRGHRMTFNPAGIITACEVLAKEDRELILQAFPGTQIINQYGATECTALAVACPRGNLHQNLDYVKLEAVDNQNQPMPVGEFSDKILITNYANTVQPIIRYELTDSVRFLKEPCGCGSSLPVIELRGRSDDTIFLFDKQGDVQEIQPLAVYTGMFHCKEIDFCQIVHVEQNKLKLRIMPAQGIDDARASQSAQDTLKHVLRSRQVDQLTDIQVDIVRELPRGDHAGKFKNTLSQVPPPQDKLMPTGRS